MTLRQRWWILGGVTRSHKSFLPGLRDGSGSRPCRAIRHRKLLTSQKTCISLSCQTGSRLRGSSPLSGGPGATGRPYLRVALLLISAIGIFLALNIVYSALKTINRLDVVESERDRWQR